MHGLGQRCQGMGSGCHLFTGPIQSKKVRKRAFSLRLGKIRKTCNHVKKIDIFILYSMNVIFSVHIQILSS